MPGRCDERVVYEYYNWSVGCIVVMLSLAMWCVGESIPERWCLQSRLYHSGVAYGVVHTSAVFTR